MYYTFIIGLLDMLVMPLLFKVFFNESVTKYYFFMTTTIYINAFSRRFYPKRLTVHSVHSFTHVSTCVPSESKPQPLRC